MENHLNRQKNVTLLALLAHCQIVRYLITLLWRWRIIRLLTIHFFPFYFDVSTLDIYLMLVTGATLSDYFYLFSIFFVYYENYN